MSSGLLVALPLESVVLRLAVALGVALVLLRIISGWELRSPRARTVLATSPFVVVAAVVLLSSGDLGLPSLLVPTTVGAGTLALPVADRYLDFVPGAPVLVAVWAATSLTLLLVRVGRASRTRRSLLADARPAGPRLAATVLRLARGLDITPPRVLVSEAAIGGAAVIGVRNPVLLLDVRVVELLDAAELEGVLAHELAHVARRDNVLAWAVSTVRDLAFFVPGAGWAVRALHREREAAADHDAAVLTRRPAALASGLLRVVELAQHDRRIPHGCAALVPSSPVVDRVRLLLSDEHPTASDHRNGLALAVAVSLVAVALAVVVPSLLAGDDGQRDALGVLVGPASTASTSIDAVPAVGDGRVFAVHREHGALGRGGPSTAAEDLAAVTLFGALDRPGVAAACAAGSEGCVRDGASIGLGLRPTPIVLLDLNAAARWQATPVADAVAGDRITMYWLARIEGPAPDDVRPTTAAPLP